MNLFSYFETVTQPNITIEPLSYDRETLKELLDLKWPLFKESYEGQKLRHHKYFLKNMHEDTIKNSIVAKDQDGKIIGAYIITEDEFQSDPDMDLYDLEFLDGKKILEGVSLFISKEYQGKGIGKKLIDYLIDKAKKQNKPIIGTHFYKLNNIKDWLKRRYLYRDDSENSTYYTIAINKPLQLSKLGKKYFKKHPELLKK